MAMLLVLLMVGAPAWAAVLEVGSSGSDVRKVQQKLIDWGYMKGTADGVFGAKTYDAVVWFQRRNGLTVDGIAGKKTQNKLYGTNY